MVREEKSQRVKGLSTDDTNNYTDRVLNKYIAPKFIWGEGEVRCGEKVKVFVRKVVCGFGVAKSVW